MSNKSEIRTQGDVQTKNIKTSPEVFSELRSLGYIVTQRGGVKYTLTKENTPWLEEWERNYRANFGRNRRDKGVHRKCSS
ncbi:hypothetical protein IPJ91_00130 [bacterium]|nr:MAG: hypothetical protein IPJ91_00130 [bacterium]